MPFHEDHATVGSVILLDQAELAQVSDKNKKTRQTPKADAGLFICKAPLKRITNEASNPPSATKKKPPQ